AIKKESMSDRFAHAGAAEHHRFGEHETRIRRKIDIDRAVKSRTVEQDRLLRQPGKRSVLAGGKPDADTGIRPKRAVDLLGGRARDRNPRFVTCRDFEIVAVPAGNPARRVDEHRLKLTRSRTGKMHPQPAGLGEALPLGDTAAVFGGKRDAADRAVRGKHLRAVFSEAHLTTPTPAGARPRPYRPCCRRRRWRRDP